MWFYFRFNIISSLLCTTMFPKVLRKTSRFILLLNAFYKLSGKIFGKNLFVKFNIFKFYHNEKKQTSVLICANRLTDSWCCISATILFSLLLLHRGREVNIRDYLKVLQITATKRLLIVSPLWTFHNLITQMQDFVSTWWILGQEWKMQYIFYIFILPCLLLYFLSKNSGGAGPCHHYW